jgi:citrate synthase
MDPISRIDPSINQLFFRGLNATELASTLDFESVLYLLVHGCLPTADQRNVIESQMIELRGFYTRDILTLNTLVQKLDVIRNENELGLFDTLLAFVSLCPIVIANQFTEVQGRKAEEPKDELGHAANFLWMVRGIEPKQMDLDDFQTSLILPMDDPDNPSLTVLHQTLKEGEVSDALLSALKEHVGPLHHGAGTEAMAMFEDIQKPEDVREYLDRRVKSGGRIFGLGHRIYRGIDPRAVVLREMLERRTSKTRNEWLLHVSDAVAREGKLLLSEYKGIQAFPNIDLYNAAVNFTFGFPPELNTSLFAISRSAGWIAHIWEHVNKKTFQKGW